MMILRMLQKITQITLYLDRGNMRMEKNKYSLSEEALLLSQNDTLEAYSDLIINSIATTTPICVIIGGQSASGKTAQRHKILATLKSPFVTIDDDDIRTMHPNYDIAFDECGKNASSIVQQEINLWTRKVIKEARKMKSNILLERTLKNPDAVVKPLFNKFLNCGYKLIVDIIAVHNDISQINNFIRYYEQLNDRYCNDNKNVLPRFTDLSYQKAAYNDVPRSIELIKTNYLKKDNFQCCIYDGLHNNKCCYDSLKDIDMDPVSIYKTLTNQFWTEDEIKEKNTAVKKLIELIQKLNNNKVPHVDLNDIDFLKNLQKTFSRHRTPLEILR